MHVTNFKSGAITAEASWPEGGETAFVSQFRKRVRLIHELAQLATTKKVADNGAQGFRINELLRCDLICVDIKQCHALANETLCAGETHTALVRKKFTNSSDAAATEVINVIGHPVSATKANEILHRSDKIIFCECALIIADLEAELLIDFVTANAS